MRFASARHCVEPSRRFCRVYFIPDEGHRSEGAVVLFPRGMFTAFDASDLAEAVRLCTALVDDPDVHCA